MDRTLTRTVYERLRDDIINLRIRPGEKVSEEKLARRYEVSRAPIRDALQKLQQEELVLVKPQAGTTIMPTSLLRARDVVLVRLLLEPHAAAMAAERLTPDAQRLLAGHFRPLERARPGRTPGDRALFAADDALHDTIWRLCGNVEIERVLVHYRGVIQRTLLDRLRPAQRAAPRRDEILPIYQALCARDPELARQSMHAHVAAILPPIDELIRADTAVSLE